MMLGRLYGRYEVRWGQKVRRLETRAEADALVSRLKSVRPTVVTVVVLEGADSEQSDLIPRPQS